MAIRIGELELATPGDVIVGGIAYGAAFAIDALFFEGGADAANSAAAAAAGALGVKYGVQLFLTGGKGQREKQPESLTIEKLPQDTDLSNESPDAENGEDQNSESLPHQ